MTASITVRKTYQYRLYRCDKKDRKLRHKIFVASTIWNHFIALQRRYYRLSGNYIPLTEMNNHVLKLRRTARFALWRDLHSQCCQNVCYRVDDGYQRFFKKLAKHPPKFKKAKRYASFTFPQKGYTLEGHKITIDGTVYKFVKHREMAGTIKTLTVKRDRIGRLWLFFSVLEEMAMEGEASTGKSGGFDFSLKDFLVDDEGRPHAKPLFYTDSLNQTRKLHRELSRKKEGSRRYKSARRKLAKHSADVANARREHHFKQAHQLCNQYDTMYFEDLNLAGMKAMWGRRVSDLSFASFLSILDWIAFKRGKQVVKIDRWYPSSQLCSGCGFQNKALTLRDRAWTCPHCGTQHQRDHNAAKNIKTAGSSARSLSASKPKVRLRRRVEARSPQL